MTITEAAKILIRDLVQDEEWQKVRRSLLGQWKIKPTWCCYQLKRYLGNLKTTKEKKLRIVMNYLVGSGFRMGKIKHPCISSLRSQISIELKSRRSSGGHLGKKEESQRRTGRTTYKTTKTNRTQNNQSK